MLNDELKYLLASANLSPPASVITIEDLVEWLIGENEKREELLSLFQGLLERRNYKDLLQNNIHFKENY